MTLLNCDLSFDPRDPYFELPGHPTVRFAVQVFTTGNGYGMDASSASVSGTSDDRGISFSRFARLGQQVTAGAGSLIVRLTRDDDVWTIHLDASHPDEVVKSVKLVLRGLPTRDAGPSGWWSSVTPRGMRGTGPLQWNYPGHEWATPWASNDAVALSVRAEDVGATVLHVATPAYNDEEEVELAYSPAATTWSTALRVPPIRLRMPASDAGIRADLDAHLEHVSAVFGLEPWETRRDLPEWSRDLDLVVTMHGQHWTGHVFNTFDEMRRILDGVAERTDPRRILAYLPGWEGRYYYEYPAYRPGEDLGGAPGFRALADHAEELGVRLMPMFGANGANVGRYPRWPDAAIRNETNRYPTMLNSPDWDGDRFPEGDQVFLNPGEPGFQAHLAGSITAVVEEYGVAAAFLDTAGFWFNDPRYELIAGYRALARRLRARHPELLLVGEGWWDAMLGVFPMSQQWLGVERDVEGPELLTRFARTTSHLAEGTPGAGSTGVHEQGYRHRPADRRIAGHLPVVSFAGGSSSEHFALVEALTAGRGAPVSSN